MGAWAGSIERPFKQSATVRNVLRLRRSDLITQLRKFLPLLNDSLRILCRGDDRGRAAAAAMRRFPLMPTAAT